MGSTGSRHDHYAAENFHRKRLEKTRSLSVADQHNTNIGFYPPPILHNLYPELENNPAIIKQLGKSTNVVRGHRADTYLGDMILGKSSVHPVHVHLSAKASSSSTSSSGCESSTSEENFENLHETSAGKPPRSRLYTPRLKKFSSYELRQTRLSVDSGTGLDDDEPQVLPDLHSSAHDLRVDSCKEDNLNAEADIDNIPNVDESVNCNKQSRDEKLSKKAELCGHLSIGATEAKKKRKKRARSLGKSLRNLRMRAFSLQSISFDESKRKRKF
ncbi:unnamed protein product [Enterobius vermicularis]|uniref:Suppressor protein SRP40-like n=1 Tax=Enterobius vermicularis TaxID=51028 RepID=A0A0N4VPD3_ENTVE|nr:unnamed protein product [Enterobius vermicularis]